MCPVQVHKPVRMNSHDFQSLMNCTLIGKTPGAVICLIQVDSKGFSGPAIINNFFHLAIYFNTAPLNVTVKQIKWKIEIASEAPNNDIFCATRFAGKGDN